MADQCLFCRIVRREIPATLIAETEDCVAFRDINPQAPVTCSSFRASTLNR
jgi:histidine triad (HIT) family protein